SLGIKLMLFHQNSRRKRFNRVVFVNRHFAPCNDWPTIQSLVNVVNGASANCRAVFESLLLCVQPGKRWQQARMNIENPTAISVDEISRQHTHVTGETNEIDL